MFAALGDAIGSRTVRSLSRPGGNLTGLSFLNTEISAKRIEMLVEILPGLKRLAVLVDPNAPGVFLDATREAAEPLGIELSVVDVGRVEAIEPAFARAVSERSDALNVLASAFFNSQRARLAEPAAVHRLPAMYETGEYVRAGGLIAYGPDLAEMFRRAAIYVDKIFKGASPADLPVEQPTKFELMINLKTSQSFGPHDPAHAPRPSPRGDRMRLAD